MPFPPVNPTAVRCRNGFTLVELLVVLAITTLLVALGWGAVRGGMEKARALTCLNSMRQVGLAVQMHATDHAGRLPNTSHRRAPDGSSLSWTVTLKDYLGPDFSPRCPCNPDSPAVSTYAWNDSLTESTGEGIPITRCRTPAATLLLGETADGYYSEHFHFASARSRITYNQFKSSVAVDRHGKFAHYLFVDGHVEALGDSEIKNRLNTPNSPFIKP
jgi:prepilin-type N-terminal cleavage/methylation domain-containing protein/prepilin-type processing-associated H-X9-DG protein